MLTHPDLRNFEDYEHYRAAMIEWDALPFSVAKVAAEQYAKNVIAKRIEENKKRSEQMTEQNFAKGMKVKVVPTKYGEIIKIGVQIEKFSENPINDDGWINIDILTSKNGKKYAVVDTYKPKKQETDGQIMQFEDDGEIPF